MASDMFEVVRIRTFCLVLSWSICVNSALTTRMESDGSLPDIAAFLQLEMDSTSSMRIHANILSLSRTSWSVWNNLDTSLPLSEKYLENNEWLLISIIRPAAYRWDRRMDSFYRMLFNFNVQRGICLPERAPYTMTSSPFPVGHEEALICSKR